MHTNSVKLALLIVVSVSQIAGGTSCCCFPRFLASVLAISLQWKTPHPALAKEPANENVCPKCCSHRTASKAKAVVLVPSSRTSRDDSISSDGKCHCVRHVFLCALDEKPISGHELATHLTFPDIPNFLDRPPTPANAKAAYPPPILFGPAGPSWQSLACVWKS